MSKKRREVLRQAFFLLTLGMLLAGQDESVVDRLILLSQLIERESELRDDEQTEEGEEGEG